MKNLNKAVLVLAAAIMLAPLCVSCSSRNNSNPPDIPILSRPQAVSGSQINIKVSIREAPDGIVIERSLGDESNYSQITTLYPPYFADFALYFTYSANFNDMGLQPETAYYYRAWAYNEHGNSAYSVSDWATTFLNGYGMCVNKTSGFSCLQSKCEKDLDYSSYIVATGVDVFDCLGLQLTAPATMTISFTYESNAYTCYNQPFLEVIAGTQSEDFSFNCHASGNGSISIGILDGQTIDDISFRLSSGDWGSTVCIKTITFAP